MGEDVNDASRAGRLDEVKSLIAAGAEVNARDEVGWTALIWAAMQGDLPVAQALIAAGAEVNATDREGQTAVDLALAHGQVAMVELIRRPAGAGNT